MFFVFLCNIWVVIFKYMGCYLVVQILIFSAAGENLRILEGRKIHFFAHPSLNFFLFPISGGGVGLGGVGIPSPTPWLQAWFLLLFCCIL
ncbi:unnamed protein product [Meloidogyne enterolobii]|uniref:Uncharacterized protein n=1 Tax=Meloidogyne enterolobii TaxID=390850 RepID=A0ACB0ZPP6_MELEN